MEDKGGEECEEILGDVFGSFAGWFFFGMFEAYD